MQLEGGIEPRFVKDLLALQTPGQRAGFLRDAGLLNPEGLDRLLDFADGLLGKDPGVAQRLAELCGSLADVANAPPAVPRANYISARAASARDKFEDDLRLTGAAYDGYVNLGMNLEALRTNVGRMVALFELGRYDEALRAGQDVLDSLSGKGRLQVSPTQRESNLLTALVYQNRGTCFAHVGRYDEALDSLAVAENCYGALDDMRRLGEIIDNRGIILRYLGRGNEALEAHESAAAVFEAAGHLLLRSWR